MVSSRIVEITLSRKASSVAILSDNSIYPQIAEMTALLYEMNEIKKTRLAYDNITVQFSKKNIRFQYKLIKKEVELLNLKMRLNDFACLGSYRRFTRQNRSESLWKTTVILMFLRFMYQILGCFVQRKT